jgi:hypothetical protein
MIDVKQLSLEEAEQFRRRVEYEDGLLISRTNLVLTLNGLGAVAVALTLPSKARLLIAVVMIIIDVFWIACAIDAWRFIRKLTQAVKQAEVVPSAEAFRYEAQRGRFRISPTLFVSIIVPFLILVAWIVGLAFAVSA